MLPLSYGQGNRESNKWIRVKTQGLLLFLSGQDRISSTIALQIGSFTRTLISLVKMLRGWMALKRIKKLEQLTHASNLFLPFWKECLRQCWKHAQQTFSTREYTKHLHQHSRAVVLDVNPCMQPSKAFSWRLWQRKRNMLKSTISINLEMTNINIPVYEYALDFCQRFVFKSFELDVLKR